MDDDKQFKSHLNTHFLIRPTLTAAAKNELQLHWNKPEYRKKYMLFDQFSPHQYLCGAFSVSFSLPKLLFTFSIHTLVFGKNDCCCCCFSFSLFRLFLFLRAVSGTRWHIITFHGICTMHIILRFKFDKMFYLNMWISVVVECVCVFVFLFVCAHTHIVCECVPFD